MSTSPNVLCLVHEFLDDRVRRSQQTNRDWRLHRGFSLYDIDDRKVGKKNCSILRQFAVHNLGGLSTSARTRILLDYATAALLFTQLLDVLSRPLILNTPVIIK